MRRGRGRYSRGCSSQDPFVICLVPSCGARPQLGIRDVTALADASGGRVMDLHERGLISDDELAAAR